MSTRGNYGLLLKGEHELIGEGCVIATYQHTDTYPSGWGYRLVQEARELQVNNPDRIEQLLQRVPRVKACDWDDSDCYWNHRPKTIVIEDSFTAHSSQTTRASFQGMLELDELFPAALHQGDVEYSYLWHPRSGRFTIAFGPITNNLPRAIHFSLDDDLVGEALERGPRGFEAWVETYERAVVAAEYGSSECLACAEERSEPAEEHRWCHNVLGTPYCGGCAAMLDLRGADGRKRENRRCRGMHYSLPASGGRQALGASTIAVDGGLSELALPSGSLIKTLNLRPFAVDLFHF